jgi:hypothetical protein
MKKLLALASLGLALGVVGTSVWAEGTAKSGPQSGERVPGPFHPLNVTGEFAGKKNCLFCSNGANPVAVVFARDITPEVTKLIKKLDEATAKNKDASMGSFAVFCTDKDGLETQLKKVATSEGIKHLILSIDNPGGPDGYKIAKDADVTVLLYSDFTVRANHAFKKGELNEKGIGDVVKDVAKIVK